MDHKECSESLTFFCAKKFNGPSPEPPHFSKLVNSQKVHCTEFRNVE
jgi:hypothetical protein